MLFYFGQCLGFIISHNILLCAIISGIVGTIENTRLLYFLIWSLLELLTFLLDANIRQTLI